MKTWDELSSEEQKAAILNAFAEELRFVTEVGPSYTANPVISAAIHRAIEKADAMQTPRFAHEYIRDEPIIEGDSISGTKETVGQRLMWVAEERAHITLYIESGEISAPMPIIERKKQ